MDLYKKTLGSCNRYKREVYIKKGEGVSVVERREREGA